MTIVLEHPAPQRYSAVLLRGPPAGSICSSLIPTAKAGGLPVVIRRGFLLRSPPLARFRVALTAPPPTDTATRAARGGWRRVVCAAQRLERFTRSRRCLACAGPASVL